MGDTPAVAAMREKTFAAEKRIALFRLVVVLSGWILYPFFVDQAGTIPWLAYTLLATATVYSLYVFRAEPYRRVAALLSAYVTSLADAAMTMLWLYATGGFDSPFYVAMYLAVIAIGFRFGLRETFFAAAAYALSYAAMALVVDGGSFDAGAMGVRVTYLFLAGLLGVVISRELYSQTLSRTEMQSLVAAAQRSEAEAIESRRLLSEAETVAHVGSWEWDMVSGRVVWSDEMYRIYGYPVRAFPVTFEKAMERVLPEDAKHVQGRLSQLLRDYEPPERTAPADDYRIQLPDGTRRILRGRSRLVGGAAGRPTRMIGTVQDVTELVAAEEARMAVAAQKRELEHAKELAQFKGNFINTAAHELRTPLTPIRMEMHLLKNELSHGLSPEQRNAVQIVDRNVQRLGRLVEDILSASRIQAGRLALRTGVVDLGELAAECVGSYQTQAKKGGITLRLEAAEGMHVKGDHDRLLQVLFNLLENALKFTPAGGTIDVRVRRQEGHALLTVEDTGAGFDPEQGARLGDPFVQLPEGQTKSGTGLGLYISRGIIELHGGRMTWHSAGPGRGARFSCEVPLAPEEKTSAAMPPVVS